MSEEVQLLPTPEQLQRTVASSPHPKLSDNQSANFPRASARHPYCHENNIFEFCALARARGIEAVQACAMRACNAVVARARCNCPASLLSLDSLCVGVCIRVPLNELKRPFVLTGKLDVWPGWKVF